MWLALKSELNTCEVIIYCVDANGKRNLCFLRFPCFENLIGHLASIQLRRLVLWGISDSTRITRLPELTDKTVESGN